MIDVEKQIEDAIDALVMAAFTEGGCSEHRMAEARIQTELRKKELRTLLSSVQGGEQAPALYQFQDRDGKWCNFMHQEHYENTVKDGSWPIRALYTHPAPALEVSQATIDFLKESLQDCDDSDRDQAIAHDIDKILRATSQPNGEAANG